MKNALFWALVAIVGVILALIGYGIYLNVTSAPSGFDLATAVCSGFVLVGALVAWELLMKPGYYRGRGGREEEPPEGPEAEEGPPRSP